jgi:hypothetical protein
LTGISNTFISIPFVLDVYHVFYTWIHSFIQVTHSLSLSLSFIQAYTLHTHTHTHTHIHAGFRCKNWAGAGDQHST